MAEYKTLFSIDKIQSLNELEMCVYQYIMQHTNEVPYMRIRDLADDAHVSTTTVLRFCRKLGCDGYAEFRMLFKQYISERKSESISNVESETLDFMKRYENGYFDQGLEKAASIVDSVEQVVFFGIGNSGCICEYGARYFTNVGKFSTAVTDPFYPFTHMNNIRKSVAIVLSVSGETSEVLKAMQSVRNAGCRIILITVSNRCTAASLADQTIAYFISQHHLEDHIDYTSQQPAVCLLEDLARRVHDKMSEI